MKKMKKSGQKMVQIFQISPFLSNKNLRNFFFLISLNSLLTPWLIITCAKFRKEWISGFENSPKVNFTAKNLNAAKDAGRYNVAIMHA